MSHGSESVAPPLAVFRDKGIFPTTEHMQESSIEEAEACLAREHLAATKVVPLP